MSGLILTFLALAAVIVIASLFLTKFADRLSEQTGLGGSVTGLVLLAGATSLPEFSIGFNAVRMDAADLTAGDVLGSSLINLLILAILDLFSRTPGAFNSIRHPCHYDDMRDHHYVCHSRQSSLSGRETLVGCGTRRGTDCASGTVFAVPCLQQLSSVRLMSGKSQNNA